VQASAPRLLRAKDRAPSALLHASARWVAALFFVPALLAVLVAIAAGPTLWLTLAVVLGLLGFGALFAINSALHSYLILAFTDTKRVTLDVGFYYMANAAGRLLGTLLSGLSFQVGGLPLCLGTAAGMVVLSWYFAGRLGTAMSDPPGAARS